MPGVIARTIKVQKKKKKKKKTRKNRLRKKHIADDLSVKVRFFETHK